jgi:hypothetical protein
MREAIQTGMSEKSAKVYTFHRWRHYFTSYMRERVNENCYNGRPGIKLWSCLTTIRNTGLREARLRIYEGNRIIN